MKTGYSVGDCMTEDPLTTSPDINIKDCAKLLKKHKIGSIVIVKKDKPNIIKLNIEFLNL